MTSKTKSHIFAFGIMLVFISLSVLFIYKIQLLKWEIEIKDSQISESGLLSYKVGYLENSLNANIQYGGRFVKGTEFQDLKGNIIEFDNALNQAPVLVYRYTELNCQECIVFGMLKLKDIKTDNVVLLSHYHDFYLFKTQSKALNGNEFSIYNVSDIMELDTLNVPYYFLLHKNKIVSDVFIPDKMFPEITKNYLEIIKQKYFRE